MTPRLKKHRIITDPDILLSNKTLQILIHPDTHPLRPGNDTKRRRLPVPDMHRLRHHIKDRDIMLH